MCNSTNESPTCPVSLDISCHLPIILSEYEFFSMVVSMCNLCNSTEYQMWFGLERIVVITSATDRFSVIVVLDDVHHISQEVLS